MPSRDATSYRMLTRRKATLRQNIGMFAVMFFALVVGTAASVKVTTDHLLHQDATSAARGWARYLTDNVADLEQIAGGEEPSAASMVFFEAARKSNQVFRFEIFNRHGYSQLVSDRRRIALVDVSDHRTEAIDAVSTGEPVVDTREGTGDNWPSFFAQAYVPVLVNERPIAVVAAYVDQTERREQFYKTFVAAAGSLCLLMAFSFGVPASAWYTRTKEKQRADRRIRFLAHNDVLTGLTNRASLADELNGALALLPSRPGMIALHFIDVDRFKSVNDTFGHDAGDFLLKSIGERLRSATRNEDIVARLGGDEFVVLQMDVADKNEAESMASRLSATLAEPVRFNEHTIPVTLSIGVAMAPADGDSPDRLMKSADLALYQSKTDGRNCIRFFLPEMDSALRARIEIESAIRNAVANDGFELHYQPVFGVGNRRLSGFEALLRMRGADGKLIPPAVFIPVTEEMRLIDRIGAWVIQEACRTASRWPAELTVAVNLSPVQFATGSISSIVASALNESGLEPARLELEITEALLLHDSQPVLDELRALKAMGVGIVMDDFGTGYSSLSYLWRFPFDKIKIDRSFMLGFDNTRNHVQTVVKTIIALGRELNMRVTVEGVETASQAEFLDKADADLVQGFYFSRPMPGADVAACILSNSKEAAIRRPPALQSDDKRYAS
jgi:diguanylate cyclase (GGDEF)-like protein